MQLAARTTLIISVFLFFLGMPMLHMHSDSQHDRDAVIHSHMPQTAGTQDADRTLHDPNSEAEDSIPIEISALTPVHPSPAPVLATAGLSECILPVELETQYEFIANSEPKAKGPPGHMIVYSLRSPPA
jgi:hypothetical protein